MTDALRHPPSSYIDGRFVPIEGDALVSRDPSDPERVIWSGAPDVGHVEQAVSAARRALAGWSRAPLDERAALLRRYAEVAGANAERVAGLITDEMGKVLDESRAEAGLLAGKVAITLDEVSLSRVREYEVAAGAGRTGRCRFKPHGVMAVPGPFNFPAHLPNGHFVPALLMGNTIVFKPSELTPAAGQVMAELMDEAGLPPGVVNVVHTGREHAAALVEHEGVDGILFTGSWPVGRRILEANVDRPRRIVALEMGGNNPVAVMADCDVDLAVAECVRGAFTTTGQRCTCVRRIAVDRPVADRFIPGFCRATSMLIIGPGRSAEPVFMGPVASKPAAERVISHQDALAEHGGKVLVEATRLDRPGWFVSPGVVEVDRFTLEMDEEVFGPLVVITIVDGLDEAIEQANATRYGLAASIFTSDDRAWDEFFHRVRAGCINRNMGTAGASSKLPFGGVGRSGNFRPAAAFSVDYCAYPVASMVNRPG